MKTREQEEVSTLMKVSPISQAAKKGETLPGRGMLLTYLLINVGLRERSERDQQQRIIDTVVGLACRQYSNFR